MFGSPQALRPHPTKSSTVPERVDSIKNNCFLSRLKRGTKRNNETKVYSYISQWSGLSPINPEVDQPY
jgi:hypothetical protein